LPDQDSKKVPSSDLDGFDDTQLLDLFARVKSAWAGRDETIRSAVEIREQNWRVAIPKAWKQTAQQHHTSRSREIPERVKGTLMLNMPVYSRPNPGEDFDFGSEQNQVERFHQAYFHHWDRKALRSRSAWEFVLDCLVGKGGVCVGSILAPGHWAGAPMFMEGDRILQAHWRDSAGKETESYDDVDLEASTRAFDRAIDSHRRTISLSGANGMPLKRRVLPPEQVFPVIVEDQLLAVFIERKASMLELAASGWEVELPGSNIGGEKTLLEVVTPNRCRYFLGTTPVVHQEYGKDGLRTNYGFVPYVYQTALSAGETDYGCWGLPVLGLVESNIRTIDTLRTYLMNAVHLASFTSFYIEYQGEDRSVGSLVDTKTGSKLSTFEFRSGTIMDFGPGRKVLPLTHPGLNADFWKALAAEEQDVDRIIPRTLSGEATSSGYNTALSSVQARALFNSLYRAAELLLEQAGEFDMRHVEKLPGPVYLEWEKPSSGKKRKYERVSLDKHMIGSYYGLYVNIDRTVDPITEGTFRANMVAQGIGDLEWAAEGAGINDYEDMVLRQARDHVFKDETIMAALVQRAVKRFGLQSAQEKAAAQGRIQMQPDGTPAVALPDGRTAVPGQGIVPQTPQAQGALGAQGGLNGNMAPQSTGGPNPAAVQNPSIALPAPTPTGRGRARRRGGAIPGGPQRTPFRPPAQSPVG